MYWRRSGRFTGPGRILSRGSYGNPAIARSPSGPDGTSDRSRWTRRLSISAAGSSGSFRGPSRLLWLTWTRGTVATFGRASGSPWSNLQTRRGCHSFYDSTSEEITRRAFGLRDCKGELIQDRQYVAFHSLDSIVKLADALPRRGTAPIDLRPLQLDLFGPVTAPVPVHRAKAPPRLSGPRSVSWSA